MMGFLVWYFFLKFLWKSKIFSKRKSFKKILVKDIDDLFIAIVVGVVLGWRLWEVFIYQWSYFSQNLLEIFAVWKGWMSFIGGMFWVFLFLLVFKKIKKISKSDFFLLLDCVLVLLPIAIALWRFWNYLNQEIFGIIVPEDFWWLGDYLVLFLEKIKIFTVYETIDSYLRVNTNFISILFEWFVLFSILISVFLRQTKRKTFKPGVLVWFFLFFYGLFRFFIEYIRADSQFQMVWVFTKSQIVFLLFICLWIYFIFNRSFKKISL